MKQKIFTLVFFLSICFGNLVSFAQCTPETPVQCPDPEDNGQICPDSLAVAYVGELYSQVATIKPPATFVFNGNPVNLHHVKLMEVGNLPSGLTWQSNATDSVFMAGEYYCVLLEGTPDSAGEYDLRIVVDVYVLIFNTPVYITTITDSTSLTIDVVNNSGIKGYDNSYLVARSNFPNPFKENTRIDFYSGNAGPVSFEVYSILGHKVHDEQISALRGENSLVFNGQALPEGPYFYVFRSYVYKSTGIMIRKD
jgi:hypothetical protein